jgi:parvulin-like peptidyl-prolyl isomerase
MAYVQTRQTPPAIGIPLPVQIGRGGPDCLQSVSNQVRQEERQPESADFINRLGERYVDPLAADPAFMQQRLGRIDKQSEPPASRRHGIWTVGRYAQVSFFSFLLACLPYASAQQPTPTPAEAAAARQVLARVNGAEITDEDVRLAILLQLPEQDARRDSESVRKRALFTLVQRALASGYLGDQNVEPTDAEVALEIDRRRKAFAAVERSWEDELRKANVSEAAVRKLFRWRIAWSRYLDRSLTEANVEKYFERFRWRFDGSRRRVAHLLLKAQDDPQDRQRARGEAKAIRAKIAAGELSFEEAVRQLSQAESAQDGGQLGWIDADGPMPDGFTQAAFALAPGEISPPVDTPFGVALIRCLEVEAGTKTYQDVRETVADFAREDLFRWIVEKRLPDAQVEFVGNQTREEFQRSLSPSLLGTPTKPPEK